MSPSKIFLLDAPVWSDTEPTSSGGTAASGQPVVPDVAAGSYDLRISAKGKQDNRQNGTVLSGQGTWIEAALAEVRENPKGSLVYLQHSLSLRVKGTGLRRTVSPPWVLTNTDCRRKCRIDLA
jgi:hypothetical protein